MKFKFRSFVTRAFVFTSILSITALGRATAPPEQVATVVVHGFDPDGASGVGLFGADSSSDYISTMAGILGLPISLADPLARNQVAYTTYYGDTYPAYYTQQDKDEIVAAGQGVPRYALIVAKYAEHVMQRSGAKQVNLLAVSFGGLISRYMIEKDLEGLASSGKIARWISIEGVVAGNWAATNGGQALKDYISQNYGTPMIDLEHMTYQWVEDNLHNPRTSSASPFFGEFPVHFWQACNDDANNKVLTGLSRKANDGVVLIEDAIFQTLPAGSKYLGLMPTVSAINATHEGTKSNTGIRAGIAAQLFGRKRVTITLTEVHIFESYETGFLGQGEYVFGARIFSPKANELYGITTNINVRRADNNSLDYLRLPVGSTVHPGLIWFDDMILPGETELRVESIVEEVDNNLIYGIAEVFSSDDIHQAMKNVTQVISTVTPATYTLTTDDWTGEITVSITDYPPFEDDSSVGDWDLY